ncbi:FkbM family methyltransferase [Bradyrhizobium sp. U87765 SZCCT0131]|uniref:FkbM family methyltransferase n=1 Tax=unclassified Bradyrhizobium TaxID=2631580 RepID=UPI001BABB7E7|nr:MULTISPECIES: FkbM family methyltransferase [unclassified Bradyrhizobium]MBR1217185.1 FkbM family methyltransferase [Bradyrhizobium sp. U87765 SZCCT0131]MBR1259059.1 FkbM family methyltransferase [Bradyrhizobium sp. U87765 SZCCT0134]MBR1305200.1 FkbM family methyltransferase [Bradyrhizobium sp. U87765 SZCCT0110]MBR1320986.1 FkbM family methyltransferase [Bradyrhizobium sp. U87765 SZCCT0109]MBR1350360.1 FkbM family methyltransferase [Bradyrhizobium sp. U87765 SZCCT0048]
MAHDSRDELTELLKPSRLTSIVDVGANPIDGDPPYKPMLQQRLCRLVGFDPFPDVLKPLEAAKSELETYLPYAVGDGGRHTLKLCRGIGFASLLQPDEVALRHFPRFTELGTIVRGLEVATRRLDDIAEITAMDMLKIDIQGSELSVFQNGRTRLRQAVAVQTEVSFIPLYKGQPVFGDIDLELRSLGFVPHMFAAINKKMIAPMQGPNPAAALNQLVEADAVYVRDFMRPEAMDVEQLKHLALVAHHCYGSFDLAMNCLHHLTGRGAVAQDARARYIAIVQAGQSRAAPPR